MKASDSNSNPMDVFFLLQEKEGNAAVGAFLDLCRRSPELRDWLWTEFAGSATVRKKLAEHLDKPPAAPTTGLALLAELAGESRPLQKVTARLRRQLPLRENRLFGGLTWSEVEKLIRHYHAGSIDVSAFMLARAWREACKAGEVPIHFRCAGTALLDDAISGRDKRLLQHLAKAVEFLDQSDSAHERRLMLGHTNWWKLCVLFYLLNHPKPRYQTRELRAHLAGKGIRIDTALIRRFCLEHAIARDTRAGRPRKQR